MYANLPSHIPTCYLNSAMLMKSHKNVTKLKTNVSFKTKTC